SGGASTASPLPARSELSAPGEAISGCNQGLSHTWVPRRMPRLLYDNQFAPRPRPRKLPRGIQRDPGEDDLRDPLGVAFGVSQSQRRAPRPAEHQPPPDAKMAPQQFQ